MKKILSFSLALNLFLFISIHSCVDGENEFSSPAHARKALLTLDKKMFSSAGVAEFDITFISFDSRREQIMVEFTERKPAVSVLVHDPANPDSMITIFKPDYSGKNLTLNVNKEDGALEMIEELDYKKTVVKKLQDLGKLGSGKLRED